VGASSAESTAQRAGTTRFVLALVLLVPLAVGALAMAGLGGSGRSSAAVAPPPKCAPGRAPRPGDVAPGFPLPASAVVESRSRQRGAQVIRGHLSGALFPARDFFARRLPASGYLLGAGDAEAYEAETDFAGNGVRGHLKLNTSFDCPGTTDLAIVLR
jgi:hypothetical protein